MVKRMEENVGRLQGVCLSDCILDMDTDMFVWGQKKKLIIPMIIVQKMEKIKPLV